MLKWTQSDKEVVRCYQAFVRQHKADIGYLGNVRKDEIQIVTNPAAVRRCVEAARTRLARKKHDRESAAQSVRLIRQVTLPGIVYEDQYGFLVRFPVLFPPRVPRGKPVPGLYISWYWRVSFGRQSAAFGLPVLPDGRIVLVRAFRHATRCWTLDIPGGGTDQSTPLEALRQELREEAGLRLLSATELGSLATNPGLVASETPVFLAHVELSGAVEREASEAILAPLILSVSELECAMRQGYWEEQTASGETRIYTVNSSALFFALTKARLLGPL